MELKVTKDKVLEASKKCPQAREALKTLFPEVFESNIDLTRLSHSGLSMIFPPEKCREAGLDISFMQIRTAGEYTHKGFFLSHNYDWEIVKDKQGQTVLLIKSKSN